MIVWGGTPGGYAELDTGGVYDPASDTWSAVSTVGAPGARRVHTAVWTGSKMIIWGGVTPVYTPLNSGGVYDDPSARSVWSNFNDDAWSDLLWHHQTTGELYTWLMGGTRAAAGSYLTPSRFTDTRWQIPGLADFNGDGTLDILWRRRATGELYTWLMGRTGSISGSYLQPSRCADMRWQIRGVRDLNGDGHPDILWRHLGTGDIYVWLMNGAVRVSTTTLTPAKVADTRWRIRGLGDFDGDGATDILWHHEDTGSLYVWYLRGLVKRSGSALTPARPSDARWRIARVSDLDGDGDPDILWHHPRTGELYVWSLDGVVVTSGSHLTPARFSDTRWKIVPR